MVFLILLTLIFGRGLMIGFMEICFYGLVFYAAFIFLKEILSGFFDLIADIFENGIFIKTQKMNPVDEKIKWMNHKNKHYDT